MLTMWFLLLSVFDLSLAHATSTNVTLDQAFKGAQIRSEDLANQGELVNQADERYRQAIGSVLPSLNFVGTFTKQQALQNQSSISPNEQRTYKISASQPLFQGFREYAALRQTSILQKGAEYSRLQAKSQLFQDTSSAFYQVLMAVQSLRDLRTEIEVNQKRLEELKEFKRIGRSRASEVLSLESNIAVLEAKMETAKILVQTTKAVFGFVTGLDRNSYLVDSEKIPEALSARDDYLAAVDKRYDYLAAKESAKAADEGLTIAHEAHLPTLNATGNYYFQRPGFLSEVKWDFSLNLVFPIFQGGVTSSQARVAASQLKQSDLSLEKTRRQGIEQIDAAYEQAKGDIDLIEKQKRASDLSEKNYQSELHDYKLGLVNNVEVLQALTTAQESKRLLDQMVYQYKIDYLKLMAQTAARPNEKE